MSDKLTSLSLISNRTLDEDSDNLWQLVEQLQAQHSPRSRSCKCALA